MSINQVWQAQFQEYGGSWIDSESVSFRNITGSACLSVGRTDPAPPIPGVLRYKVLTVNGNQATLSCSITNIGDAHHPSISASISITTGTVEALSGIAVSIASNINVNDVFEIAYGYSWDDSAQSWAPAMAFGILIPGEPSTSVFMKITNIAPRPRVNAVLSWENDGPDFVAVRLQDGTWVNPSIGQIYLQDANGIEGYMDPDGECTLELMANPSPSLDSSQNMIQVSLTITSLEI